MFHREPTRRSLLATVSGGRGPAFTLDRTLFAPTSHVYRHPAPADRGEVWVGGDKRILTRVVWDRGEVRHAVRGTTPPTGAAVRLHLDGDRRDAAASAHAAMHLVLSQFARRRLGVLTREPEVQGGRQFTITARWTAFTPHLLKDVLDAATQAQGPDVKEEHVPQTAVAGLDRLAYEDGWTGPPEEPTWRIVRIGDASALPCDGVLPEHTRKLGRIVARRVQRGRQGAAVQFRAEP